MSMLSFSICGKNCYIATETFSKNIACLETKNTSEIMLNLLKEFQVQNFKTLIYSTGPGSFTSIRVIGAIAKGILLSSPDIKILSISTFLTLFSIISQKKGTIAINTMRGDFHCMDFDEKKLINKRTVFPEKLNLSSTFFDEDILSEGVNLAEEQIKLLKTNKFAQNQPLVSNSLVVDYGTNPIYKI